MDKTIKVLICDDSALMRKAIREIVESDNELFVCGVARDGEDAVQKARQLRPDVVTMDINMPGMDGITALQYIVDEKIAPVIMVSSLTEEGAMITFEAMALGAFDYVTKPGGTISKNIDIVREELISKIKAAASGRVMEKLSRKPKQVQEVVDRSKSQTILRPNNMAFKAVALGISTGGPKTIFDVLPYLPADLNASVFVVQHMPPAFTSSFAKRIDNSSPMKCVEAEAGMVVEPGVIYLAKGGYHMTVYKNSLGKVFLRTSKQPQHLFMPSVDIMMNSVLDAFGTNTIGVLMTGMGDDGAEAMVSIRRAGGKTIAESEESSIVFGMPREAIERGGAEIVAPSWEIARFIINAVNDK